ncbi:MAG: nucleotidyl transferase AbiEii/AbiGii toxin family protein [Deltaproteobacteria bacterium]|nr:nucleotidyl transferase AbiEii/AbiGii toxin family protein [Deltaproteobacteria bacterium]
MTRPEPSSLPRVHEDPARFREAVRFTAAETLFLPRLIEKDYFCTLLLGYLSASDGSLVFKGGTCLAKVHAGFYRLSEDLDFVIPTPLFYSRSERRRLAEGLKGAVSQLSVNLNAFRIVKPLTGANNSTQYVAVVAYTSLINRQEETVKIEAGLREPLLTQILIGKAQTLLLNPVSGKQITPAIPVPCISWNEAMAEKLRAALSRREAAIRDFYDIDYAVRKRDFLPLETAMTELVRQKLAVPCNEPVDISPERLATLRQQLHAELKTVLREKDFREFDLERAFRIVKDVAAIIG